MVYRIDFEIGAANSSGGLDDVHRSPTSPAAPSTGRKFFFGPDVIVTRVVHRADVRLGRPREAAARDHARPLLRDLSTATSARARRPRRTCRRSSPTWSPAGATSNTARAGCSVAARRRREGRQRRDLDRRQHATSAPTARRAGVVERYSCSANLGIAKAYAMPLFCVAPTGSTLAGGGLPPTPGVGHRHHRQRRLAAASRRLRHRRAEPEELGHRGLARQPADQGAAHPHLLVPGSESLGLIGALRTGGGASAGLRAPARPPRRGETKPPSASVALKALRPVPDADDAAAGALARSSMPIVGWRLVPALGLGRRQACCLRSFSSSPALTLPYGARRPPRRRGPAARQLRPGPAWSAWACSRRCSSAHRSRATRCLPASRSSADPARSPWRSLVEPSALARVASSAALVIRSGASPTRARYARVVRIDVPVAGAADRRSTAFTIAQVSDVHVGPTIKRPYVEAIVDAVNRLDVDVVAITGDLVDGSRARPRRTTSRRSPACAREQGSFFVTGNHEYYSGADDVGARAAPARARAC